MFVCFIFGVLSAVQYRTQASVSPSLSTTRVETLSAVLHDVEQQRDALQKELEEARKQVRKYEQSASEGTKFTKALQSELEKLRLVAGLTPVGGPGLSVVLEDSTLSAKPGEDPNVFIVHYEDILQVTNELFSAGAEAVAVNNQRLIATSEIRCAGPIILINGIRLASPYVIHAIGDPKALESALKFRGGIVETLQSVDIRVRIVHEPFLAIPAYTGGLLFEHAKILEEGK